MPMRRDSPIWSSTSPATSPRRPVTILPTTQASATSRRPSPQAVTQFTDKRGGLQLLSMVVCVSHNASYSPGGTPYRPSRRPLFLMEIPAHSSSPDLPQEAAHLRAVSLAPGLSRKGSGMKKSSLWKMVCVVCMFCIAAVIASPAQTLSTIYSFCSQTNCADGALPHAGLVQGSD